MVLNSVSETETPPTTPPPPSPPPPPAPESQPPVNPFVFSATKSEPIKSYTTDYSKFRWSLNHPNVNSNGLGSIPENQKPPLLPFHNHQSPQNKFGLGLGFTSFTFSDSGLNRVHGSSSSGSNLDPGLSLGPPLTENNKSPGLGFFEKKADEVDKPVEPVEGVSEKKADEVEKPVEVVSEKKLDVKGKGKVCDLVPLPERNKGSGSGSGHVTDEDDGDDDDGEAEVSCDDEEEPNFVKNWNVKEEEEGKKTWNLRPRKAVPKPAAAPNGGGRTGQTSRARPAQATSTRPRAAAAAAAATAAAVEAMRRPMFSLTLTKEEIEEDFMIFTGSKPPKKCKKKRPKNLQKLLDVCFPGVWLHQVNPEKYKVDPPLKHTESTVLLSQKNGAIRRSQNVAMLHALNYHPLNAVNCEMVKYKLHSQWARILMLQLLIKSREQ